MDPAARLPSPARSLALAVGLSLGALGCAGETSAAEQFEGMAPPIVYQGTAYEVAGTTTLPEIPPQDLPGLHNVYRLSEQIISGGEPQGEDAFDNLQAMGVKTILSVDGKVPDAEAAARHGIRYVHIPIHYNGIEPAEMLAISKTFREQEGPFYVHCFHGKHRGPAAAAVGRIVLDGSTRTEVLAEMRQWCGTSPDYEGLYASIAAEPIPDAEHTEALDFDFAAVHRYDGVRGVMVPMPRAHDALKAMASLGWTVDPSNPDVDPVQEARILQGLMQNLARQDEAQAKPDDFRGWMADAGHAADELLAALEAGRAGLGPQQPLDGEARRRADTAHKALGASCKACHAGYRD